MYINSSDAGLAVKFSSPTAKKVVLVSSGSKESKESLLDSIVQLESGFVEIWATPGTSAFLTANGVKNKLVNKISTKIEPNILTILEDDVVDLVVNILVGEKSYDEASDSSLIRSLAIRNDIPLVTDTEVAIEVFRKLTQSPPRKDEAWDLKSVFLNKVAALGGFKNHHAHLDKAYLISEENLSLGRVDMQKKWKLYRYLKENYTHEDLVKRMSRGIEAALSQGATYFRTMVDADSVIGVKGVTAALEVQKNYRDRIKIDVGVQPLEGVIEKESRKRFEEACEMSDFVGGLPSRDRPRPEKHLDIILEIAKRYGKMIDVHVDQENNPEESETELLALKTIEYGLEGMVFGVHAISVGCYEQVRKKEVLKKIKDSGLNIICCPSAAISMKQHNEKVAPIHNSIAPVPDMLEFDIPVFLGIDNISDLFMPMVDADMYFECRLLMEACRLYDLDVIAEIATRSIS